MSARIFSRWPDGSPCVVESEIDSCPVQIQFTGHDHLLSRGAAFAIARGILAEWEEVPPACTLAGCLAHDGGPCAIGLTKRADCPYWIAPAPTARAKEGT